MAISAVSPIDPIVRRATSASSVLYDWIGSYFRPNCFSHSFQTSRITFLELTRATFLDFCASVKNSGMPRVPIETTLSGWSAAKGL